MASVSIPAVTDRIRSPGVSRSLVATAIVGVASVMVALVLASRLSYVPMWDGFVYASAINRAAAHDFRLADLRLSGHASHVYAAYVIAAQLLAPGEYWPLLVANAALLALSISGFARLSALVFPGEHLQIERSLLTAAFSVQPALLSAVVQPGLDLPIVPGIIWTIVFLLRGRWLAAALAGLALAFTKETGVLLYAALIASLFLWRPRLALGSAGDRVGAIQRVLVLAIPGIAFAAHLLYRAHSVQNGEPVVWNAGTAMIGQSLVRQLTVPRIDRYLATYLALIFVLNFAWIATLGAASGFVVVARSLTRERNLWPAVVRSFSSETGFIAILAVTFTYALTRFASYANARYVLVVAPLLGLLFVASLVTLGVPPTMRRTLIGVWALLTLVSVLRTIDPMSRAVFGTFRFGHRELLTLNSITHECCARGRDQLGYNLEFTTLAALTDDALAAIRPGDSTLIVLPDSANWYVMPQLDARTGRRTVDSAVAVIPLVVESDSAALYATARRAGVYLALPNAPAERGLSQVEGAFVVGPERRFTRGPYSLSAYRLTPR